MISDDEYVYISLDIEHWELEEFISELYPLVHETFPNLVFEADGFKRYEEEYGGFISYGIVKFKTNGFTQDEVLSIKKIVLENVSE